MTDPNESNAKPPACHHRGCHNLKVTNDYEVILNIYNARIAATDEEVAVIARTMNHAAEVLVCFWISRTGSPPGEFSIGSGPPAAMKDNVSVSIFAQGDASGVVVVLPDGSTTFDPATS